MQEEWGLQDYVRRTFLVVVLAEYNDALRSPLSIVPSFVQRLAVDDVHIIKL